MGAGASMRELAAKKTSEDILKVVSQRPPLTECRQDSSMMALLRPLHLWRRQCFFNALQLYNTGPQNQLFAGSPAQDRFFQPSAQLVRVGSK